MNQTEENNAYDCSDHRIERIGLSIPDIPLSPEEWVSRRSSPYWYPPLEHLIERAERHTESDREESYPSRLRDDSLPEEDLSREKYGNESLSKVSELIIVVAILSEYVSNPVKQSHLSISIVPSDTEDDRMDEDEGIEKIRKRKLPIGHEYENESYECREDLENPHEIIMGRYRRPDKDEDESDEEGEMVGHGDNYIFTFS